jgi:hypothetical protein
VINSNYLIHLLGTDYFNRYPKRYAIACYNQDWLQFQPLWVSPLRPFLFASYRHCLWDLIE